MAVLLPPADATSGPVASDPREHGVGAGIGTCGELVQGVTSAGEHFTVSCPIERSAAVEVMARPAERTRVVGLAPYQSKMVLAARRTLEVLEVGSHHLDVRHRSDLDIGKGMGSSTADITAVARGVGAAFGRVMSPEQLAGIATSIEPSDGSMYPGIVAMARASGRVVRPLDWTPRFVIVMVVPPETYDTGTAVLHDRGRHADEYEDILDSLELAAHARRGQPFADAAARSAELNQSYLPNPHYPRLRAMQRSLRADGVVVGHTGTVAGLLFLSGERDGVASGAATLAAREAARAVRDVVPSKVSVEVTATPPAPLETRLRTSLRGTGGR